MNETGAHAVAAAIGGRAFRVDASDGPQVRTMAAAERAACGRIDILVNNAGTSQVPMPLEDVPDAEFDRVFAANAKTVCLTARHILSGMKTTGPGAILEGVATAGLSLGPLLNWFNAFKGWMVTATNAMAVELAPHGIRVNALCQVAGEAQHLPSFLREASCERRAALLATNPLGRFSTSGDLANAALFPCSDEAAAITGAALKVDGGRCK